VPEDRKVGSEGRTIKVDASGMAGAIGKATRKFVTSLDCKQHFDLNKRLKVEAVRVTTDKEKLRHLPPQPEVSKAHILRHLDFHDGGPVARRSGAVKICLTVENPIGIVGCGCVGHLVWNTASTLLVWRKKRRMDPTGLT
jgi:hypothetical protein